MFSLSGNQSDLKRQWIFFIFVPSGHNQSRYNQVYVSILLDLLYQYVYHKTFLKTITLKIFEIANAKIQGDP